jgi:hypothetical protein
MYFILNHIQTLGYGIQLIRNYCNLPHWQVEEKQKYHQSLNKLNLRLDDLDVRASDIFSNGIIWVEGQVTEHI